MGYTHLLKYKNNETTVQLALASLAAIAHANDLEGFLQSKDSAVKMLRAKRQARNFALDPDEWCKGKLGAPECWHEFTETVWQPLRFQNLVEKKEGQNLYWCVVGCNLKDQADDFVGNAYEEKREVREEFQQTGIDLGAGKGKFYAGYKQCCKHIPKSLWGMEKVQQACPELRTETRGGYQIENL